MTKPPAASIHDRKREHLALSHTGPVVGAEHRGLFDEIELVHDALPELALHELELGTDFFDHRLAAPLMVTGMTGGPPEAGDINRRVAALCQRYGLAMGVGSQRVITKAAESLATFQVRDVAPDIVLLGNLGVAQARDLGLARVAELKRAIGADYMAIHLNPGQELVQGGVEADRDFRGALDTLARLVEALDGKVLVKECGTGLSPRVVARLAAIGVRGVDVSGTGGTSWIKVEALRNTGRMAALGHQFAGWGVPTAAAVAGAAGQVPLVVASGGIDSALTAAKALALGADVVGAARPVLQALLDHGDEGGAEWVETLLDGLRLAMVLTGCRRPGELRQVPRVLGPRLQAWIAQADRVPQGLQDVK